MIEGLVKRLGSGKRYVPLVLSAVLIVAYSRTMNPTVSFIDSGELAAVASLLGIAHPTGYPFFSILGKLVVMIVPFEPILSLNSFAVVLVGCALGVFYLVALEVLEFLGSARTAWSSVFAASGGTMVLAFSSTVWAQSVSVEVYSLHIMLLVLFLLLFLKGIRTKSPDSENSRFLILAAFVLGLAFTNHMTTLLVIPACLYLYGSKFGIHRQSLSRLTRLLPFFFLGLSLYAYLPIRSAQRPPLDWGHPAELERFYWHVSGKQYRSWIFSGFETAEKQLAYFVGNFSSVFSWIAIALMIIGLWTILARSRRMFWFVILLIATCVGYSINYDIHDIDSYFLLAYVGAGFLVVFGMHTLLDRLRGIGRRMAIIMIVVLPILEFLSHRDMVDESDNFLVHDYTMNTLASLDSNAVVFTYQWDYLVSASYYFQLVKKIRPDVIMVDKELLRRSWYFIQLKKTAPWLIEKTQSTIDPFLSELYKFEHGQAYNGAQIEARFNAMVNAMIDTAMRGGPVYVGAEIEPQFAGVYERVPDGLLHRLQPPGIVKSLKDFDPTFKNSSFRSRLSAGLKVQYAKMLTLRAIWLLKRGDGGGAARASLRKAIEFDSSYVPALRLLTTLPE
ncbi:MAG: DUF2723 domain-containing protein [Bacteroidota bacterium]